MPAQRKMAPRLPSKQWQVSITITDAPEDGEDYWTEDEILEAVKMGDRPPGITVELGACKLITNEPKKMREI